MKDKISVTKKDLLRITVLAVILMLFFFAGFFISKGYYSDRIVTSSTTKIDIWQTIGVWAGSLGTIAAIVFLARNTNKQIENQNKESHRPYLRITGVEKPKDTVTEGNLFNKLNDYISFDTKKYISLDQELREQIHDKVLVVINVDNPAFGVACNVYLEPILGAKYTNFTDTQRKKESFLGLDVVKESKHIYFVSNCILKSDKQHKKDNEDELSFLIFYSDIYGNVYSSYISFKFIINIDSHDRKSILPPKPIIYNQGSKMFNSILEKNNIDFATLKSNYEETMLSIKLI